MIQCKRCKRQYVGETKCTFRERFKEHRQAANNPLHANATAAVPSHFQPAGHSIADMELILLELQPTLSMSRRKEREAAIIGSTPPPHPSPPRMENAIKRMTPVKKLPYPCDIALLTEFVFK